MPLSDFFAAITRLFRPAPPLNVGGDIVPVGPAPAVQSTADVAPANTPVEGAAAQPATTVAQPVSAPAAARPMTPAEFIAAIAPAAQACARRTHVPASVTVAQAALESSWGVHAPGMNLFGIKADASWHGPFTVQLTHEVEDYKTIAIHAEFRAYSDWQGSIEDHGTFLATNPRYRPAFACTSGPAFATAIAACGYATDPLYAAKLKSVIAAHNLSALDA
ncbi:glycoside hydrolase family 73 protein [Paraburkholderia sp. BR14263]|uniref:glycoside hydrolase family 73 protein n=1 Tax=unclassified Paraburkholderia TaxID=2615204 RepID=UPI0034CF8513